MSHLLLTIRFVDNRYHGLLARGGQPEWPPSPFRLFQSLLAGVARRRELVYGDDVPNNEEFTPIGKALGWLQRHTTKCPPIIIAPKGIPGQAITRYVPNNDGDKKYDRQGRLTAKPTNPTLFILENDQKAEVHYVWDVNVVDDCPVMDIDRAARAVTTLGWGIDMAFAEARLGSSEEVEQLNGIRWTPKKGTDSFSLRVPTYNSESGKCSMCDLRHCHGQFSNRIERGKPLRTVDKPSVFERVLYSSIERPFRLSTAVFKLMDENDDTVAYQHSKLIHIAGMVRSIAIKQMKLDPPQDLRGRSTEEWIDQYVAGHKPRGNANASQLHEQFSFIPLPSTGMQHTDPGIRRVMIVAPPGDDAWLEHLAQHLDGQELKPESGTTLSPGTHLQRVSSRAKDGVRDAYTRESQVWASFTPVILPGHDDHKPEKTRKLILKALAQSDIEHPCEFEWSAYSHFPKSFSAHKYVRDESVAGGKRLIGYIRPDHMRDQTAVHLRITFEQPVPGPITLGAGRHCGFGLMAKV